MSKIGISYTHSAYSTELTIFSLSLLPKWRNNYQQLSSDCDENISHLPHVWWSSTSTKNSSCYSKSQETSSDLHDIFSVSIQNVQLHRSCHCSDPCTHEHLQFAFRPLYSIETAMIKFLHFPYSTCLTWPQYLTHILLRCLFQTGFTNRAFTRFHSSLSDYTQPTQFMDFSLSIIVTWCSPGVCPGPLPVYLFTATLSNILMKY